MKTTRRKILSALVAICMMVSILPQLTFTVFADSSFGGGEGTSGNPYLIKTVDYLKTLAEDVNSGTDYFGVHFRLENDLDLGGINADGSGDDATQWTAVGSNENRFGGTFDGGNHLISGLYINRPGMDCQGLFGYLGEGGTIKNIKVDGTISVHNLSGGVCGYIYDATIQNCSNTGSVNGSWMVGGVCGDSTGTIENCYYREDCVENNPSAVCRVGTAKTTDEFASGEVAYLLQAGQSAQVWGQDLKGATLDATPVLTDELAKKVYQVTFATEASPAFAVRFGNPAGLTDLPAAPSSRYWSTDNVEGGDRFTTETPIGLDMTVYAVKEPQAIAFSDKVVTGGILTGVTITANQNLGNLTVFAVSYAANGALSGWYVVDVAPMAKGATKQLSFTNQDGRTVPADGTVELFAWEGPLTNTTMLPLIDSVLLSEI